MDKNKYAEIIRIFSTSIYKAQLGLNQDEREKLSPKKYTTKKKKVKILFTRNNPAPGQETPRI